MRIRRDLRQTIELVAGGGTTAVLTFAYILLAGRRLGPADYADFSAALSIFQFVAVAISPLGPTMARLVARSIARGEPERAAVLRTALSRRVIRWGAFAIVPLLLAAVPLARIFRFQSPVTLMLALASTVIVTLINIDRGMLQGEGRFREHVFSTITEAALRLSGAAAILAYAPSPSAALACYFGALLAAELFLRHKLPALLHDADFDWGEVKSLAGALCLAMIGIAIYTNSDVLAVKRWFSATDAGHYAAASSLAQSVSVLFVPIYTLAGPLLTGLHERNEPLFRATLRLCAYFGALAAMPAAILASYGTAVIELLYGSAFSAAGPLVARLVGVPILTYLSLIIGQALITTGDRRFGPAFIGFAVLQVIAITLARGSIASIICSLYMVQSTLLLVMLMLLWRTRESS
jgi:O-antigen/teichoic acid export membrane protein